MLLGRRVLLVLAALCVASTLVLVIVEREVLLFSSVAPAAPAPSHRDVADAKAAPAALLTRNRRVVAATDEQRQSQPLPAATSAQSLEQQLAAALVQQQKLLADQQQHLRELSELRQALLQQRQARSDERREGGRQQVQLPPPPPPPPPPRAPAVAPRVQPSPQLAVDASNNAAALAPATTTATTPPRSGAIRLAGTGRQLSNANVDTAVAPDAQKPRIVSHSSSTTTAATTTTSNNNNNNNNMQRLPVAPPPPTTSVALQQQQQFLQQQRQRRQQQQQLVAEQQQQAVTQQLEAKQRAQQVPIVLPNSSAPTHTPDGRELPVRVANDPWNTANFEPYLMVIGMHRSLTSGLVQALAETMNFRLASYYTGNWELSEVQLANDLLLQFSQSRWDHVNLPLDRPFSLPIPCVPQHTRHIQYLNIGVSFTQEPRTGALVLKDPRFALTLPYWQRCLPKPPHVVFIFRSPIEVARSLEKRDAMPLRQGIELWYQYNKLGLMHISSVNHTIIESRDLLDQPHKTLEFLFDVLSNQWQLPRLLAPLDGGALHVAHTSSRPPTDREDLERQVGEALQQELGGAVTLFDVMELYDELMRRRFSVQTIPLSSEQ